MPIRFAGGRPRSLRKPNEDLPSPWRDLGPALVQGVVGTGLGALGQLAGASVNNALAPGGTLYEGTKTDTFLADEEQVRELARERAKQDIALGQSKLATDAQTRGLRGTEREFATQERRAREAFERGMQDRRFGQAQALAASRRAQEREMAKLRAKLRARFSRVARRSPKARGGVGAVVMGDQVMTAAEYELRRKAVEAALKSGLKTTASGVSSPDMDAMVGLLGELESVRGFSTADEAQRYLSNNPYTPPAAPTGPVGLPSKAKAGDQAIRGRAIDQRAAAADARLKLDAQKAQQQHEQFFARLRGLDLNSRRNALSRRLAALQKLKSYERPDNFDQMVGDLESALRDVNTQADVGLGDPTAGGQTAAPPGVVLDEDGTPYTVEELRRLAAQPQ